jgi:type I site-specific restriction-modification system R (restriction) subunit
MKAMMPNAIFIGFTGTPLLKKDRQTSLEVFGGYIHTYAFFPSSIYYTPSTVTHLMPN